MFPAAYATKLYLTVGTHTYDCSDGDVLVTTPDGPVYLMYLSDEGLGTAPLTRFSERGPSQHGDTDIGMLLEPRIINYIFAVAAPNINDDSRHLDTARMLLMRRFPVRAPITLRYDRANGDVLQIDGYVQRGPQFGTTDREVGTWFQRFAVEFRMGDPTWYNPDLNTDTITEALWSGGLDVPMPVPFSVGSSVFDTSMAITYEGSWETYPRLRINGPITNPLIRHIELGLNLHFEGSITTGDYWDILLDSAPKSVVDSGGTSVIRYLLDPNDLSTFRLDADPDLADGLNTLALTGTGTSITTSLDITYTTRYIGI